jgi:tripeptide aminopeptidase
MPASWASDALPLFLELAAVSSPSGDERVVADRVFRYLSDLGLDPHEDGAAAALGSTTGNIVARIPPARGESGVPIFLCAHMDTVPAKGALEPVVEDGIVTNAAGTILGADNKAAVAAMLDAARLLLAEGRPHAGVELVFTVCEETGCQGASALDEGELDARIGFVYDFEGPIGEVVVAAPYQRTIDAVFKGRAAHAGIAPEEGRSAIVACARAIADLRLGRLDHQTTANVGTIEGGVARNIVPDRCRVVAEARALEEGRLDDVVAEMLDCLVYGASISECEVETQVGSHYPGYRVDRDDPALAVARTALERSGFVVRPVESNGGADANVFNGRGLRCVNLANGMTRIHSPDERISVDDLEAMVGVTLELIDAARAAC